MNSLGEKKWLKTIIGIASAKLLIRLSIIFLGPFEIDYINIILGLLSSLSNFFIISFLFAYIKYIKEQKVYIIPILIMTIIELYLSIAYILQMPVLANDDLTNFQNAIISSVPYFISLVAEIFFSIQLINNKAKESSRNNIKLVGICNLGSIAIIFFLSSLPALLGSLLTDFEILFIYIGKASALITLLPLIAIINLFIKEINIIESSEYESTSDFTY
jgi:hypothetical protein